MGGEFHSNPPGLSGSHAKSIPGGPPLLTRLDKIISLHHGSTTAIEASRERLQASKQYPDPTLSERIDELHRQNSNLNHEVTYFRQMEPFRRDFRDGVSRLAKELGIEICRLDKVEHKVNSELAQLRQRPQSDSADRIISLYEDPTTVIEVTAQKPQDSERCPSIPSESIEQLQRNIGLLNQKLALFRQTEPYKRRFKDNVAQIAKELENAVTDLGKVQQTINHEWVQLRQGVTEDL